MRAFLEQYGIAIFVLVIIGIMVLMASGVGATVEGLVTQEIKRFTDKSVNENKKTLNGTSDEEVAKVNEYGFYFDRVYATEYNNESRTCYIFKENNKFITYRELNESYYDKNKSYYDAEYGVSSYEEANEKYKAETEYTSYIYYDTLFADDDSTFYFNHNGKIAYWDEAKTNFRARLLETGKEYSILISGRNFNNTIPSGIKNIEFLTTAAPIDISTQDVSTEGNGSILAWTEGDTYYIAPKNANTIICSNPNSSYMFAGSDGESYIKTYKVENIVFNNFDTSLVTNMSNMFYYTGYLGGTTLNIEGLENWDTSNVTNMQFMFFCMGENDTVWNIGDLSSWDVGNVTKMINMFMSAGKNATTWSIGDLSNWNMLNVESTTSMFYRAGENSTTFDLSSVKNWDVSNIEGMNFMFSHAGKNANYSLDLSGWNFKENVKLSYFEEEVEDKIITPWD